MPELPDVEIFRRRLEAHGLDRPVRRTTVAAPDLLAGVSPQSLGRLLKNHPLVETRRHGKYLFAARDGRDGWLVLHFGMSGSIQPLEPGDVPPGHSSLTIDFDEGGIAYVAPRRLGMIGWTENPDVFVEEHQLGPDALSVERDSFVGMLAAQRGMLKCRLMDQACIAGIGNVYADEMLFQAGLHPRTEVAALDGEATETLHAIMRRVLTTAIEARADPDRLPSDWLLPHREKGAHCPRCDGELATVEACGRRSWYCPDCQRG
ncbi:MAG: Fpg/Nei family DNA glycosylase [Pseudomonadota bacterium]